MQGAEATLDKFLCTVQIHRDYISSLFFITSDDAIFRQFYFYGHGVPVGMSGASSLNAYSI